MLDVVWWLQTNDAGRKSVLNFGTDILRYHRDIALSRSSANLSFLFPVQAQLRVLLQSTKDLLSQGAFCPKLLWQEYRRDKVGFF